MLDKSKKIEENKVTNAQKSFLNSAKKASKNTGYMTDINGIDRMSFQDYEAKLESDVIAQLKSEFPGIEKTKSFTLLVDAVVNNIKKKDLEISDKRDLV